MVTSAVSDEEEEVDDDYEDDEDAEAEEHLQSSEEEEEEEEEYKEEPTVQVLPPKEPVQRRLVPTKQRAAAQRNGSAGRAAFIASAPLKQGNKQAAPALTVADLTRAVSEVPVLSGAQWRQRLQKLKEQVVQQRYSRGERLVLPADSAFLDAAEEAEEEAEPLSRRSGLSAEAKEQPTVRAHGRARSESSHTAHRRYARHHSLTSSDLPLLAPFEPPSTSTTSAPPLSFTLPSASASALPSTARSTVSAAFAAKHSTFAKDLEGMEQERRELLRDKRALLAVIARHQAELASVQAEWQRAEERLLHMARAKGMMRVGEGANSRFEPRPLLDDGRLNPALSTPQLVLALQREIEMLEREKEVKEVRQDEVEERERRAEEVEGGEEEGDGEGEGGHGQGEVRTGYGGRRRLRALRERKRQLLEKLHAMQDQLLATRQRPQTGQDSGRLAQLETDCRRLRAHYDEYQLQREKAIQRLERSATPPLQHPHRINAPLLCSVSAQHRSLNRASMALLLSPFFALC